jgi:hypothetical protein
MLLGAKFIFDKAVAFFAVFSKEQVRTDRWMSRFHLLPCGMEAGDFAGDGSFHLKAAQ